MYIFVDVIEKNNIIKLRQKTKGESMNMLKRNTTTTAVGKEEILSELTKIIEAFDVYRDTIAKRTQEAAVFDASINADIEYKWFSIREVAIMMLVANGHEVTPGADLAALIKMPSISIKNSQDMDQSLPAKERAGYILKSLTNEL